MVFEQMGDADESLSNVLFHAGLPAGWVPSTTAWTIPAAMTGELEIGRVAGKRLESGSPSVDRAQLTRRMEAAWSMRARPTIETSDLGTGGGPRHSHSGLQSGGLPGIVWWG